MPQERVVVFDTTLRDGEQAPGFSMDVAAKVELARAPDVLGVDVIEAGFPIASPADFEGVRSVSREVRRPTIAALARCAQKDVDEASGSLAEAERGRIHDQLVLGRHSGRHAVATRCEALGLPLTAEELARVYRGVITMGVLRKSIGDGDLRRIVNRVRDDALA